MHLEIDTIQQCLSLLQTIIPFRYAQWLIEDSQNHDYRVVAAVLPAGEVGYDVAHRTGIIGQVFRLEQAILAPDVGQHPLYDSFDSAIDWELCFPVFAQTELAAVVNLEGDGRIDLLPEMWYHFGEIVEENTQFHLSSSVPQVDSSYLIETRRIVIDGDSVDNQRINIIEMAQGIARGGQDTLLVGDYPEILCDRRPTLAEAIQQGVDVSYCYFGVERRLDLLATGPMSQQDLLEKKIDWWKTSQGRYTFVLEALAKQQLG